MVWATICRRYLYILSTILIGALLCITCESVQYNVLDEADDYAHVLPVPPTVRTQPLIRVTRSLPLSPIEAFRQKMIGNTNDYNNQQQGRSTTGDYAPEMLSNHYSPRPNYMSTSSFLNPFMDSYRDHYPTNMANYKPTTPTYSPSERIVAPRPNSKVIHDRPKIEYNVQQQEDDDEQQQEEEVVQHKEAKVAKKSPDRYRGSEYTEYKDSDHKYDKKKERQRKERIQEKINERIKKRKEKAYKLQASGKGNANKESNYEQEPYSARLTKPTTVSYTTTTTTTKRPTFASFVKPGTVAPPENYGKLSNSVMQFIIIFVFSFLASIINRCSSSLLFLSYFLLLFYR